jgi:hypothetical protein
MIATIAATSILPSHRESSVFLLTVAEVVICITKSTAIYLPWLIVKSSIDKGLYESLLSDILQDLDNVINNIYTIHFGRS